MKRAWIGVALLAASWLVGLDYYYPANWLAWAVVILIGTVQFGSVSDRWPTRVESAAALMLIAPVAWLAPWPYRAGPLLVCLGLLPEAFGATNRWWARTARSGAVAGLVYIPQSLMLLVYEHWTARSHELPAPLTGLVASISRLLGIESALDENDLVLHTMRKMHRLGATWELLFDPATACFLAGGLALLAIRVWSVFAPQRQGTIWVRSAGTLLLAVATWLPLRTAVMLGLFLHRALRTDYETPFALTGEALMSQFWNTWVLAGLLAGPVLLAWRFLNLLSDAGRDHPAEVTQPPRPRRRVLAALAAAAAVTFFMVSQFWDPPGEPKAGRIAVDEFHSDWERTDRAMDTSWYGQLSAYNYYCIYEYLSRFYEMSRLMTPIDESTLAQIDVLIIKTPTARYTPQEIDALERFVARGGGLLLIGEHTDVFHTGEYLNEISRRFGFTFRYDCLFGVNSPFEELYVRPLVAHPIVQAMPPLDFEISCSIDPGSSPGQAVMSATGLWNLPPDYHALNYYPQVEDRADARYGAWIQTWATRQGQGRVVAYTDSTQFSNFSAFEPGKPEVMLGMLQWLNRRNSFTALGWLFAVASVGLAGLALWLARGWRGGWLVCVAAGAAGWFSGVLVIQAAHAAEMPLPPAQRPMVEVVMDRTVSTAPLPKGGFIAGKDDGFGIFERNLLRLGYFTSRRSGSDALHGDLLVVLHPNRDVPAAFRDAVVEFVKSGGKLLVLDSAQNERSTANSLLFPLGLSVDHATNLSGTLSLTDGGPAIPVSLACRIVGGEPLAHLDAPSAAETSPQQTVVAASRQIGKGSATVVGFAGRFSDFNLGVTGDVDPDAELRKVYEVQYALLRKILGSSAGQPTGGSDPPATPTD